MFVLDGETSECLHYEPVIGYPPTTHIRIPREILAAHPELEIRNDLIDCSIDVCSVEVSLFGVRQSCVLTPYMLCACILQVPSLFQDNFDYSDIRKDFVHGVLTSDLLQKNIHCYVAKEGYAARVRDTRSYDSIRFVSGYFFHYSSFICEPTRILFLGGCSKDILARWTFPLVPDDNHPGGHVYEYLRGNKYIAKDNSVVLSRYVTPSTLQ